MFPCGGLNAWMYIRLAQHKLTNLLDQFAALVLVGPRQTGKTTLAFAHKDAHANSLYVDMEFPSAQRQLDDPESFFMAHPKQLSDAFGSKRRCPPSGIAPSLRPLSFQYLTQLLFVAPCSRRPFEINFCNERIEFGSCFGF